VRGIRSQEGGERGNMRLSKPSLQNYQITTRNFEKDLSVFSNEDTRTKIAQAIRSANVCVSVWMEFGAAFTKYADRKRAELDGQQVSNDAQMAELENQLATAEKIVDPDIKYNVLQNVHFLLLASGTQTKNAAVIFEAETALNLFVVDQMQVTLFERLFSHDRDQARSDATLALVNVLIGLTNIGPIVSGLQALRDGLSGRRKLAQTADAYLNYLDDFLLGTRYWAVAALFYIRNLNITTKQPILPFEVAEREIAELLRA
jgi:hypothetical protein